MNVIFISSFIYIFLNYPTVSFQKSVLATHIVIWLLTQAKMIFGNHEELVHLCLKQKACFVSRAVLAW